MNGVNSPKIRMERSFTLAEIKRLLAIAKGTEWEGMILFGTAIQNGLEGFAGIVGGHNRPECAGQSVVAEGMACTGQSGDISTLSDIGTGIGFDLEICIMKPGLTLTLMLPKNTRSSVSEKTDSLKCLKSH
ncbi:MAG: hypothetical protein HY360_02000 [Verrucomicrobia bacterium]|nr:hypothetical protein [Verrucomicrobiota bacterium]